MKFLIALSALVSCGLAVEEAKVIAAPMGYDGYPYAGYPYAGYPYAGHPYAGYPYSAPVAAPIAAPVAAARLAAYSGYPYAASIAAPLAAPVSNIASYAAHPYAGYPYSAPAVAPYTAPIAAAPLVAPYAAPYSAGSQFHAQDEFGNLNYGYANLNSVKQETGNTYGGVSGGYSYVDAAGKLQQVTYVADGLGFRTQDSRLPVAPVYDGVAPTFNPAPLVAPVFNPEPLVAPEVTPEVAEATAAHLALVEASMADRKKREADPAFAYGFATAHPGYAHATYAAGYPYSYGLGYHGLGYNGLGYHGLPYYG